MLITVSFSQLDFVIIHTLQNLLSGVDKIVTMRTSRRKKAKTKQPQTLDPAQATPHEGEPVNGQAEATSNFQASTAATPNRTATPVNG